MSRPCLLTEDQEPITGMFWLPGDDEHPFSGTLHLKAGKSAKLRTHHFNYQGMLNMFPSVKVPEKGESLRLQGEAFSNAMRLPAHTVLHGHDEHGKEITLIHASARGSQSTLAMSSMEFSCEGAVFGAHFDLKTTRFSGIRLRVDHLDEWVGRCAFQHHQESYTDKQGVPRLSQITIPVARDLAIPLGLPGYRKSHFFCAWSMRHGTQQFELNGKVYLDLLFEDPLDWWDLLGHVLRWEWFFSLAARDPLNLSHLELYPVEEDAARFPDETYNVWLRRRNRPTPIHSKRRSRDFHFSYSDVEQDFPAIVGRWQGLQTPWEAALHRFFAVTAPRDLWMNEEFLFLAQGIESMHRAKQGLSAQKVDLAKAAKSAWESAHPELQELLGKKREFIDRYRKTRNYWTHYGEPSPSTDSEVLGDDELIYFSEKLRFVLESAMLAEIGVPPDCIRKVWSQRWRMRLIDFE